MATKRLQEILVVQEHLLLEDQVEVVEVEHIQREEVEGQGADQEAGDHLGHQPVQQEITLV
jgi:hypothetical protein